MKDKIDYEEITKLINFLEEKKLALFELEVEGFKIKISLAASPGSASILEKMPAQALTRQNQNEKALFPAATPAQEVSDSLHYVTSPMVGTFYRAPDPTSPPFVDVGEEVKKSQTLCIIEAMKLMNEIESEVEGVIKEIYAENGKPVEYGQRLFAIQPII
jgi:acetyl-CoA carboxylase biotin carboxyl carrier protein